MFTGIVQGYCPVLRVVIEPNLRRLVDDWDLPKGIRREAQDAPHLITRAELVDPEGAQPQSVSRQRHVLHGRRRGLHVGVALLEAVLPVMTGFCAIWSISISNVSSVIVPSA